MRGLDESIMGIVQRPTMRLDGDKLFLSSLSNPIIYFNQRFSTLQAIPYVRGAGAIHVRGRQMMR